MISFTYIIQGSEHSEHNVKTNKQRYKPVTSSFVAIPEDKNSKLTKKCQLFSHVFLHQCSTKQIEFLEYAKL